MDFVRIFLVVIIAGFTRSQSTQYNQTFEEYRLVIPRYGATVGQNVGPMTMPQRTAREGCQKHYPQSNLLTLQHAYDDYSLSAIINATIDDNNLPQFDYLRINAVFHMTDYWTWVDGGKLTGINFPHRGFRDYHVKAVLYNSVNPYGSDVYAQYVSIRRGYVCEYKDDRQNCSVRVNDICYQVKHQETSASTWFEARNDCVDNGGDLASFASYSGRSSIDELPIKSLLIDHHEYWLGGQRGVWLWNDTGPEMKYTNWVGGTPGNRSFNCLCLHRPSGWKWVVCDCDSLLPFICSLNSWPTTATSNFNSDQTTEFQEPKVDHQKQGGQTGQHQIGFSAILGIAVFVVGGLSLIIFLWLRNTENRERAARVVSRLTSKGHQDDSGETGRRDLLSDDAVAANFDSVENSMYDPNLLQFKT